MFRQMKFIYYMIHCNDVGISSFVSQQTFPGHLPKKHLIFGGKNDNFGLVFVKGNHSSFLPFTTCSALNRGLEIHVFVVAVQRLSRLRLFETPWTAARQASLSFTISRSLFKLMSIESTIPSNHLILCCPLLLLPSIFPRIRESFPMRWLFKSG